MKMKLKFLMFFFLLLAMSSIVYAEQPQIVKQKDSETIKIPLPADWVWNDGISMYTKKNQSSSVVGMFGIMRISLEKTAPLVCNSELFRKGFLQPYKEALSENDARIEETTLFGVPAIIGTIEKRRKWTG